LKTSTRVAIVTAALVGSAIFLQIFGFTYLLGTSHCRTHPHGDAAMTLMGWNYFIHDAWHWLRRLDELPATEGDGGRDRG